jgi:hypothetical protein
MSTNPHWRKDIGAPSVEVLLGERTWERSPKGRWFSIPDVLLPVGDERAVMLDEIVRLRDRCATLEAEKAERGEFMLQLLGHACQGCWEGAAHMLNASIPELKAQIAALERAQHVSAGLLGQQVTI